MDALVELKNISKTFGTQVVLNRLSVAFQSGKIYSLIGASGSGKTTLLRLINGLELPTSGEVLFEDKLLDYGDIVSTRRQMGYCIQGSGLFPHMTVMQNVTLLARRMEIPQDVYRARADVLMNMVALSPSLFFKKKPGQLSGGEKQRVGIVRALMTEPKLLLMDEPFGALDPMVRKEIQNQFLAVQKKLNITVIMVTHDIQEAFKMSDEVIVLHEGGVVQSGLPLDLLDQPRITYVKDFLRANASETVLRDIYETENVRGQQP